MGGRSIACMNSRDRNLLGFRRDLLTAAAYGVDQFLLVYGDKPGSGGRTSELTVRSMIEEAALHGRRAGLRGGPRWRIGVAAALRPLPAWKQAADFIFIQVSYSARPAPVAGRQPGRRSRLRGRDGAGQRRHGPPLAAAIPDIEIPAGSLVKVGATQSPASRPRASR